MELTFWAYMAILLFGLYVLWSCKETVGSHKIVLSIVLYCSVQGGYSAGEAHYHLHELLEIIQPGVYDPLTGRALNNGR